MHTTEFIVLTHFAVLKDEEGKINNKVCGKLVYRTRSGALRHDVHDA